MSQESLTDAVPELRPISAGERIAALDVVRGFALIGIFLMNIEFFNRPIAELGQGLPSTLQGADWWAGYLIYILVQGKFWTMFSLLFGMGFAVMLTRAERAGRTFLVPYLRRIAALAAFGAAHHIFLWAGDILFSYAVGAVCLLLLLWAPWYAVLGLVITMFGLSAVPGLDWAGQIGFGLLMVFFAMLFLRSEPRQGKLPFLSGLFFTLGTALLAFGLIAGNGPVPVDARWPLLIGTFFMFLLGTLSWRYKQPAEARPRRLGGTMYLIPMCVMLSFGLLQMFGPERPKASEAQIAAAMVEAKQARADERAGVKAGEKSGLAKAQAEAADKGKAKDAKPGDAKPVAAKAEEEPKKSPTEQAAMREANRRLNRAEHQEEVAADLASITTGSYWNLVSIRAKEFVEHAPGEFGFSTLIVGMFLLGYWFVRTGIMEHTREHLPLFRKMAIIGIPLGVGLGILATQLTTHQTPGMDRDPYQVAMALTMIGNLPACLGYVGLLVLMVHSNGPFSKVKLLAPLGRMALTNYLTHSLVSSLWFYGYAGGHYGMHRATQVLFVFSVIAVQLVFCHWWLSKFRYGPMEWLWRAITYWQLPPMRREAAPALGAAAA